MSCNFKTHTARDGISIIEVLTSLVVAAIGVTGVLVLIPFSAQQMQKGLDLDRADALGQNVAEDFIIRGYTKVDAGSGLRWQSSTVATTNVLDEVSTVGATVTAPLPPETPLSPQIVHLDPLAMSFQRQQRQVLVLADNLGYPLANGDATPDILSKYLPGGPSPTPNLKIPVGTVTNSITGLPLSQVESRQLTLAQDELVFGDENLLGNVVSDVEGPQPYFDLAPSRAPIRFQTEGSISWSALMVPQKGNLVKGAPGDPASQASSYKMFTLLYADRNPLDGPASDMVANIIDGTQNVGFVPSVSRLIETAPVADNTATAFVPTTVSQVARRDDWVMLINQRPSPDWTLANERLSPPIPAGGTVRYVADEAGFDIQVTFCRVLSADQGLDSNLDGDYVDAGERPPTLSVEGGAFDFYDANVRAFNPTWGVTYVVHLKNVVNVFERTISLQ